MKTTRALILFYAVAMVAACASTPKPKPPNCDGLTDGAQWDAPCQPQTERKEAVQK